MYFTWMQRIRSQQGSRLQVSRGGQHTRAWLSPLTGLQFVVTGMYNTTDAVICPLDPGATSWTWWGNDTGNDVAEDTK
jgi:hypothetical protein